MQASDGLPHLPARRALHRPDDPNNNNAELIKERRRAQATYICMSSFGTRVRGVAVSWPWLISKLQMGLYPDDGALAGMCLIDKAKRCDFVPGRRVRLSPWLPANKKDRTGPGLTAEFVHGPSEPRFRRVRFLDSRNSHESQGQLR